MRSSWDKGTTIYRNDISRQLPGEAAGHLAAPQGVMDNIRTLMDPQGRRSGASHVDYSLARRATLRAYKAGRLSRFDLCDAHPDLLRAARFAGERTSSACPVCDRGPLVFVRYVFSDDLSKNENGRVW